MDETFRDHLRIPACVRQKLLNQLDGSSPREADVCRRQHPRLEYRALNIAVSVVHPAGGQSRLLACSRNISAGGMAFLHGGFLHPGSECTMVLPRREGSSIVVVGHVRHCRHVQGSVHEIGIQFEHEINPEELLTASDLDDIDETDQLGQSMQIPVLIGSVLVVDDSGSDRRLFVHQLQATGLEIDAVETPGKTLDAIKRRPYDIIVVGLDLASGDGVRVVQRIRELGYRGPVLVFTAEFNGEILSRVRAAGVNEIVGKPYDPFYVMYLLCESLEQPAPNSAVYSRYDDEPEMAGLLAEFVAETRLLGRRLAKAVKDNDLPVVRELCLRMAGSGTNHGFDRLSGAARDALRDLDSTGDMQRVMAALRRVISISQRLRTGQSRRSA